MNRSKHENINRSIGIINVSNEIYKIKKRTSILQQKILPHNTYKNYKRKKIDKKFQISNTDNIFQIEDTENGKNSTIRNVNHNIFINQNNFFENKRSKSNLNQKNHKNVKNLLNTSFQIKKTKNSSISNSQITRNKNSYNTNKTKNKNLLKNINKNLQKNFNKNSKKKNKNFQNKNLNKNILLTKTREIFQIEISNQKEQITNFKINHINTKNLNSSIFSKIKTIRSIRTLPSLRQINCFNKESQFTKSYKKNKILNKIPDLKNLLSKTMISPKLRAKMIDWIISVVHNYPKRSNDFTIYRAILIMDLYIKNYSKGKESGKSPKFYGFRGNDFEKGLYLENLGIKKQKYNFDNQGLRGNVSNLKNSGISQNKKSFGKITNLNNSINSRNTSNFKSSIIIQKKTSKIKNSNNYENENNLKVLQDSDLHLIGITSIYIASKYEDIYHIPITEFFSKIGFKKFSYEKLKEKEFDILNCLSYNISFPCFSEYIDFFIFEFLSKSPFFFIKKNSFFCHFIFKVILFEDKFYDKDISLNALSVLVFVLRNFEIENNEELKEKTNFDSNHFNYEKNKFKTKKNYFSSSSHCFEKEKRILENIFERNFFSKRDIEVCCKNIELTFDNFDKRYPNCRVIFQKYKKYEIKKINKIF